MVYFIKVNMIYFSLILLKNFFKRLNGVITGKYKHGLKNYIALNLLIEHV